ncbi:leucine-rich repeat flightless-interacting protein 1 isoform X18 [Onychostoma macrolepis]|uniref:leucine-rich repeat flightless-interacting protein 1 isoform X18 n=1 Tax=Onychostoma macrolepis TaxID=369639 RepID=UPI00272B7B73|nr:leucine-rich repeat flightless-interacting protein 1 isoform X18 [Onychostoma macrolepis]
MGSQGPGRKRTPSKNGLTAEEDALNVIAKEAEARLAAKRAARAEAREIRMRELERQQKEIYQVQKKYYGLDNLDNKWGDIEQWMEDSERYTRVSRRHASVSDDEERMSVGSRSNIRLDLDAAGAYGGLPQASSYHSHKKSKKKKKHSSKTADDRLERDYLEKGSSRSSTISGATLTSLGGTSSRRGSGDTSISADTEASIREIKDSLLEVEEKYRKAMVSNAQLDNEKTNMMYEVDTLKDSLMELEEMLFETRRELEEKCKDLEREKHAHSILQFQFSELKETLKQSEELLTKHGIVLGPDLATNGETEEEVGTADQNSQTASAEIREGSSVLGTRQLKVCKDQQQKDLDDGLSGNQQFPHAPFSSTNAPLEASENGDHGNQMNQAVEQLENRPEQPASSVGDDELTATRPKEEIKSEAHITEDSRGNTVELECIVHKDGHLETDQQESECVKPSQVIKEEAPLESVSGSVHAEPDKPGETVLDDKLKEEPVESSQTEKLAKTQGASASNKKKKKKKKSKQKQKQSDKQDNDTKIDDKNETVCSEDNPNQKTEGDLEGNHQEPLGYDISETMMNTDVPHDAKRTSELDGIKTTSTNINADDVQDNILLVTDEADLAGISKTISNFDCPESSNGILSDNLSSNVISNPANIIDKHTEDSTNPDSEAVVFSCELLSTETETSLPHVPSAQSMDAVEGVVESTSCSDNIEKYSSVDMKEVKSHLNCEVEEQEENVQNIDLDGTTNPEDQDDSAHPSSPVMEKVENEAERVIQEQPIDQPMENQLQDSIGAELDQEEVERRHELDKENLKAPTEKVSDTQDSIGAELEQEEVERQDDLDEENLKAPTEKVSDTQDSIGAELEQEEVERQDDLDEENLKAPTEKVSDTQDSIGAELEQEEVERQDDLDEENLKRLLKKCLILKTVLEQNWSRKRLRDQMIWMKKTLTCLLKKCLILKILLVQNWTRKG